ncbi:unannotated protein [freshwater metagenome]|uniref:Unannotated protein n=1 Tax=freshwater metagenome TaxID=449393 RepID=A0A6J6AZS8_9ZZZZ
MFDVVCVGPVGRVGASGEDAAAVSECECCALCFVSKTLGAGEVQGGCVVGGEECVDGGVTGDVAGEFSAEGLVVVVGELAEIELGVGVIDGDSKFDA